MVLNLDGNPGLIYRVAHFSDFEFEAPYLYPLFWIYCFVKIHPTSAANCIRFHESMEIPFFTQEGNLINQTLFGRISVTLIVYYFTANSFYFTKISWKNVVVDVVEPVTEIKLSELRWKMPMILLELGAFRNPFDKSTSRVRGLKWGTLYI